MSQGNTQSRTVSRAWTVRTPTENRPLPNGSYRSLLTTERPADLARPGGGSAPLGAHHRDERHALARRPAEVVRERELAAPRDAGDLALASLAAELQPRLEEHAQPGGADRVAEGLEPAVRIHRELALEVEGAVEHFLPRGTPLSEAEVLHQHQFGGREAVVHLGHRQLGAR